MNDCETKLKPQKQTLVPKDEVKNFVAYELPVFFLTTEKCLDPSTSLLSLIFKIKLQDYDTGKSKENNAYMRVSETCACAIVLPRCHCNHVDQPRPKDRSEHKNG